MTRTIAGIMFLIVLVQAMEGLATAFGVHVPGAIAAMALLFAFFLWQGRIPDFLEKGADGLVRIFPLLFIPALVMVSDHWAIIAHHPWLLLSAISVSTLGGLAATALIYRYLTRPGK